MALSVDCGKVRPEAGCTHVIQADSEAELMRKVAEHAQTHNLEPTPELVAKVKQHIERT
jgi:predicted small metal-binding protein